jgi:hypothetical protein
MNWSKEKRQLYLFVVISLLVHIGFIQFTLMRSPTPIGPGNPFRLTLNLQKNQISQVLNENSIKESNTKEIESKTTPQTTPQIAEKNIDQINQDSPRSSGGWGSSRASKELAQVTISERRNLESRLGQQKMQQYSLINANIGQMMGRLQMMQIQASCSLRLSEDFAWANLECSPKQFEGLIKENLAPSHLRWSEKSEFKATTCISIASLSSERACE